jgi:hypothetical protein
MTVLLVNHGMIQAIGIGTTVIRPMIKCVVGKPRDCFVQEVQRMLAIREQLSTLSALDLDRIHHVPHRLL